MSERINSGYPNLLETSTFLIFWCFLSLTIGALTRNLLKFT